MGENATNSTMANAAKLIQLEELDERGGDRGQRLENSLDLIKNAKIRLQVSLGKAEITVRDLLAMKSESIIKLDRAADEAVDLMLEGKVIARGTLVAVDDNFGIRITQMARDV